MIEILGWLGTVLVLLGYILNSKQNHYHAMFVWIIGDIMWISYDILRHIYPHLFLSSIIIILNLYGIYNIIKKKRNEKITTTNNI